MNKKNSSQPVNNSLHKTLELINNFNSTQFNLDINDSEKVKHFNQTLNSVSDQLQALYQEQVIANQKQELFADLAATVSQSPQIATLLKTTVNLGRELLNNERVIIYKFNPGWSGTVIAESSADGLPSLLNETIDDPCFRESLVKQYLQGRIRVINNVYDETDLSDCHLRMLEKYQVKSNLIVPIKCNERRLYGLLIAQHCSEQRVWQEEESEFLEDLAAKFAYHLQYVELAVQQQTLSQQKQLIRAISTRTRDLPKTKILFQASVEGVQEILQTDRVVIYQFNPDWTGQIVAESVREGFKAAFDDEIQDPCFRRIYTEQYRSGRIRAINNIYQEPGLTECHLNLLERYQVKANLIVPLRVEEKLYGLLIAHQCTQFRDWQKSELDFLSELTLEIAYSLEYIKSIEKDKQINQQKQLFSAIASRTRDLPQTDILFKASVEGVKEMLDVDRVVIYQFNNDWTGQVLAESVTPGFREALHDEINDPCFKRVYTGEYRAGRVKAVGNVYQDPSVTDCYLNMLERYQIKANLVVPLRVKQKLYGLLIAHQCTKPRHWQQSELDFMSQIAIEISYSLEYINFIRQQESSSQKAWFFGDIAFRARQSSNLDDIFKASVQGARQMLATDRVVIYQFNPDWSGTMIAESVDSDYNSVLQETIDDPCFRGNYVDLYRNGRVRAINNIWTEEGLTECHIRTLEKYQVKANLVAPIRQNNQLMGLIIAHHCRSSRTWNSDDTEFMTQLATQIEYAADHIKYVAKIKANARYSRLYGDLAFRARQSLSQDDVLTSAVQGARKELDTDRVVVYRFNSDWSGTMIKESVADGWVKIMEEKIDDPCFRGRYVELYQNGRVRAINDIFNESGLSDCHIRTLEQYDVKANLIAPLRKNGKLYGLLIAHHCRSIRIWQKEDLEFFSELATQTEYALDHITYIRELEQAKAQAEQASQEQRLQKEAIEKQLEQLITEVKPAFHGNLTVRAKVTQGEIGQVAEFVNSTLDNLHRVVQQVKLVSEALIEMVNVNQHDIEATYQDTLHQAESVSMVLDKIQQMDNSIQRVASHAQEAKNQVNLATVNVKEGDQAMNQTVEGILEIQDTVEETASKLKSLGEASQKISRVVNLIKDLASQTQVLALNASLETTGSQGQDFSGVAQEVRSLSEQSTSATQEIEQILEQIQLEVNLVTTAMEKGRDQVITGVDLVENSRDQLTSITNMTQEIRSLVEDVAQAATSHAETSSLISQTMEEVEVIAQNTSQQSVKGSESFRQLFQVAQELQESVAKFKVN